MSEEEDFTQKVDSIANCHDHHYEFLRKGGTRIIVSATTSPRLTGRMSVPSMRVRVAFAILVSTTKVLSS